MWPVRDLVLSDPRSRIATHRTWTNCAVAKVMAAPMRRWFLLPLSVLTGTMSILAIEILFFASLFLNLAIAEGTIRRGQTTPARHWLQQWGNP